MKKAAIDRMDLYRFMCDECAKMDRPPGIPYAELMTWAWMMLDVVRAVYGTNDQMPLPFITTSNLGVDTRPQNG
jgi:hypothetical protein